MSGRPGRVPGLACAGALGLTLALAVALCGQVAGGGAPAAASTPVPTLRVPLAAALTTPTGSWVVVAMGQKGQPLNTFWELFSRTPAAAKWKLVTPAGVADNGGLTVSVTSAGSAIVGFEPSQLLRFSPTALSGDDGATWDAGLVPDALVAAPDALAVGSGGTAVALVRHGDGEVLTADGPLMDWRPLAGGGPGAAAARCDTSAPDAVALSASNGVLLGTGCRRPGQVGVFTVAGGRWQLVGPSLRGSLAQATTHVLRLATSGSTTSALVAAARPGRTGLLGLFRSATGTWTETLPFVLSRATTVVASAIGASGQEVVLLHDGGAGDALEETAGPDHAWVELPRPPAGTAAVAPLANGGFDAFTVAGERLRVYTLAPSGGTWTLSQQMTVPIAYGTSS